MHELVIVVDDHAGIRELLVRTLAAHGFTASAFASAEAAQAGANWAEASLALIDWMMPGMPGTDLITWVAEHHPDVHLVVVTAAREALLLSMPEIVDHAVILDKTDLTPERLRQIIAA
ncbi:response regulator [Euzebya tangerina]|uniref:response regulator n=1 Tax=Euzebya tangerina TaxID=591198 RepID=UPI0013C2CF57|nr:response regulator [Euzebya tangerina]